MGQCQDNARRQPASNLPRAGDFVFLIGFVRRGDYIRYQRAKCAAEYLKVKLFYITHAQCGQCARVEHVRTS